MYAVTAIAVRSPEKQRSGDAHTWFEMPDEGIDVAAVADGVGAHSCDWAASGAARGAIMPDFVAARGEDPCTRLSRAAGAAHDAV